MSKLMTAKEYAKHVGADVRTVRRWMRDDKLKFTQPAGHHARLIDSSQPRPKKKGAKSNNTAERKVKPKAKVPGQTDKRSSNVASQPREKIADLPTTRDYDTVVSEKKTSSSRPAHQLAPTSGRLSRKPAFEKELQSPKVKPAATVPRQSDKRPPNVASQPREKVAEQDNVQSALVILAIIAFLKPGIALFEWVYKKIQQRRESSLPTQASHRQNTWQKQSLQPDREIASLPKYTPLSELFKRQDART